MQYQLNDALISGGLEGKDFSTHVNITPISTTDPEIIEVEYPSLFMENPYIRNVVKIEVSGRSMSEPIKQMELYSMVDEVFPDASFAEGPFSVRAVLAERTFLEKIFLLHEEFSKPIDEIRVNRMSRHMYDIAQMLDSPIAERAINDRNLYNQIIEHRRTFIGLRGFNYDTLQPETLSILPPVEVVEAWKEDYENMRLTMIYGQSLTFEELIEKLKGLNKRINEIVEK